MSLNNNGTSGEDKVLQKWLILSWIYLLAGQWFFCIWLLSWLCDPHPHGVSVLCIQDDLKTYRHVLTVLSHFIETGGVCVCFVSHFRRYIYSTHEPRQANLCLRAFPSWHILTAHAQPFRGARDLAFCLKVPLDSLLIWASSESSGETARMRRLAWTFAARIGYKYQIRLTRSTL